MASTLPRLPIFQAIASHDPQSTVVIHSGSGRRFTYGELLGDVADAKDKLLKESGESSINGQRIAFLVENSYDYVGAHIQGNCYVFLEWKLIVLNSYSALYIEFSLDRITPLPGISGA
jgi:acyl-CoA synthetase (AMP-forming)/AMP-acid ligase II